MIEFLLEAGLFFLPFSKSAAEVLLTLALAFWIARKIVRREKFPSTEVEKTVVVSYSVFLLAVVLSLFQARAESLATGLRGVLKWVQYLGIFFLSAELFQEPARRRRLVTFFLGSMGLVILNGYYQMFAGADLVKGYSVDIPGRLVRMTSSLPSSNDLASFLTIALPLAFFCLAEETRWSPKRLLYATLFILTSVAFLLTFSRSAFLALGPVCALYLLFRNRKHAFLLVLILVGFLLAFGTLRENVLSSFNVIDRTIAERFRYWTSAWNLIREHPFTGHGVNLFTQKFSSTSAAGEIYRGYAHNCYLQMWAEIGILGLAAFLAPFFTAIVRFVRAKDRKFDLRDALLIGILAFALQAFFDTQFYGMQTSVLFWIFWGTYASKRSSGVRMTPSLFNT